MSDPHDFQGSILEPLKRITAVTLAIVEQAMRETKVKPSDEGITLPISIEDLVGLSEVAATIVAVESEIAKRVKREEWDTE